MKKIISFDPAASKNLGWAKIILGKQFVCSADTFVMKDYEHKWQVYWPMFQLLNKFLSKEKPDLILVEETSRFGSFASAQVSQCMGSIFSACAKHKLKIDFVFPSSVKLKVAGYGKATKSQVKKAVKQMILNMTNKEINYSSEHAYDAMANILFFLLQKDKVEALTEFPWLRKKK